MALFPLKYFDFARFLPLLFVFIFCNSAPPSTKENLETKPLEPKPTATAPETTLVTAPTKPPAHTPVTQPKKPILPPNNAKPAAPTPVEPSLPAPATAVTHAAFDKILRNCVSATGKVQYKILASDPTALDQYCQYLSDNPPTDQWTRSEKMAYWINAYNAYTLRLIASNYPIKSIMALDNGATWKVARITLGGKKYSLDQIENDILRPQFTDPRIHFAINCAARSCPPLYNRAFNAEKLESQLAARTEAFINNPNFNKISADKAELSALFQWYAADFGDLRAFINRYSTEKMEEKTPIHYLPYDWDLNE